MDLGIPPTTIAPACVGMLGIAFFSLAFLIDWIRNWRHVQAYWLYGIAAGLVSLAFDTLNLIATSRMIPDILAALAEQMNAVPLDDDTLAIMVVLVKLGTLVIALIGASRLAGFTMLGMHYAASMGHLSFPLLRRLYSPAPAPAGAASVERAGAPQPSGNPGATTLPAAGRIRARRYILSTVGVAAAAVAYTVVLFRLVPPRVSEMLLGLSSLTVEDAPTFSLQVLVLALSAAFGEELIYRLGIQGFLARYLNCQGKRYWIPIVLAALLWTLGHVGATDPVWVKPAQILPIGLMLGWLYRRCGVESCILAHALFNLSLIPLATYLVSV